jgi:hypothetical protein
LYGLYPRYELLAPELSSLSALYDDLQKAEEAERLSAIAVAIRRFNQAFARSTPEDRIIDFCIALESSLLSHVSEELTYRLSLRGAVLLAAKRNPEVTKWLLRMIYNARSAIVHNGKSLSQIMERKTQPLLPVAPSLDEVCEDIVRHTLCSYIRCLASGETLKEVNEDLDRRLLARL